MKKIVHRRILSALALAFVTTTGCATDSKGDDGSDDVTSEASQAVTASFQSSCFRTRVSRNSQPVQAILDAWADGGCRRFDGSISGPQHWSGQCFTDVSNCDGRIVCQNHCP